MADESSILSLFQLTDEQMAAATQMEGTISVQAGAGSGKTRALVGRFLALLESGLPLRSLVAITFTDKAAREMRNRIRGITSEWLAYKDAAADQEQWNEVFSALDSARISTIHGLCATILRAHPAEAGVDPVFGLLEEGQSAVWQARAVEAALVEAVNDDELAQLFQVYQEGQVRRILGELLQKRLDVGTVLGQTDTDSSSDTDCPLSRWSHALADWFEQQVETESMTEALALLESTQSSAPDDKLELARCEVLSHWERARQAKDAQDWDTCFLSLAAMRKATAARGGQKGNWDASDLATVRETMKVVRAHYEATAGKLIPAKKELRWALDEQAINLLTLVRHLFMKTMSIYAGYKDEANALDFDDLEQMTAHLLRDHDTIRRRWQREISAVLLVDEFQDTNERQRQIVYALAGFQNEQNESSDKEQMVDSDSAASLFVVGDAKQSIYRFRGADVAVFRQVQQDIREAGGKLIDFNLTFRAHKDLLEITNQLLAPIMSSEERPDRPYDVPFAPLVAFRQEPDEGISAPYLSFEIGLGENKAAGRRASAFGLASHLKAMHDAGEIAWKDVALLFRSSTAYGVYEDALEEQGIPYVTIAGRGFFERPEIRDLLNALAAIADPTDDLAMAGFLRSPAIGCSDAMIHRLRWADDGTRRPFWAALRELFTPHGGSDSSGQPNGQPTGQEDSDEALAKTQFGDEITTDDLDAARFGFTLLETLHWQTGRVSVAHLLKSFLDETHYRSILTLVSGGERLRRNVDKLLDAAHRSQLVSVSAFLEYVEVLRDVGARESEAPTEAGGAVQLMTIHKSKGLEFPVVVLADAGYTRTARSAAFYLDKQLGLVLNPPDEDAVAVTYRLAAWQEAEQEAAEQRRLLYVAATRAMEKLIVSGDVRRSTAKASPGKLLFSGWLQNLAEVAGFAEEKLEDEPTNAHEMELDLAGAKCQVWPQPDTISENGQDTETDHPHHSDPASDSLVAAMLLPIPTPPSATNQRRLPARSPDPTSRLWQVVTNNGTSDPAPDWVVSYLTHIGLQHWHFPEVEGDVEEDAEDGKLSASMIDFFRPFALQAGLTDSALLHSAMNRANNLLLQLWHSEFYAEIHRAERSQNLPYTFVDETSTPSEVVSGVVDLLYRPNDGNWTIAECITAPFPNAAKLDQFVQRAGYDRLLARIAQIVAEQLGEVPLAKLIFLDVDGAVAMHHLNQ